MVLMYFNFNDCKIREMKFFKFIPALALVSLLFSSCEKYKEIQVANYPSQQIYMPSGTEGNSPLGIYNINALAVPEKTSRYSVDLANNKLNLPLSVYRSGANLSGAIPVDITINTDTISKLIISTRLPVGTILLPSDKYSFTPSITIADNKDIEKFSLEIRDLDFLLANVTNKYAIALGVTSTAVKTAKFGTTVILIDPAFLVPTALFTTLITGKLAKFTNTSTNALTFTWNFGNGSPEVTEKSPSYTYPTSGTYTVTLTAQGACGEKNKSVKTATIVIP